MKLRTHWDYIKSWYTEVFSIPPYVVDYMAVEPVLELCVAGRSNYVISQRFELELEYVESILNEFLDFGGWKQDLDISPISLYNSYGRDFRLYKDNIESLSKLLTKEELDKSYAICKKYDKIRKDINEYAK